MFMLRAMLLTGRLVAVAVARLVGHFVVINRGILQLPSMPLLPLVAEAE